MTDEQKPIIIADVEQGQARDANGQPLRELTPEEQQALKQAQQFLNEGVACANELMPHFNKYQVRQIIYAFGIAIGAQAKSEDELKNFIGTVIHVAQHQFFFGEKKEQQDNAPVDGSEAQPS